MAIDSHRDLTLDQPSDVAPPATDTRSAYERIGGGPAVKELIDRFYELVLSDKHLARYFTTDMQRLKWHQAALFTSLLGGPNEYQGRGLGEAHKRLRIPAKDYATVASYLVSTMESMRLPADVVQSIVTTAAAVEKDIVRVPVWRRVLRWRPGHRAA